jgi:ribosomal-protein-alanine N-acetyltransferase
MNGAEPITIRRMRTDDLEAIEAIDRESFPLPWPPGSYRYELDFNPRARCWTAETGGRVIGALVGWLIVDEYQVATLAVHPDERRRGAGKALLEKAIEAAKEEGAARFTLEVRASNSAAKALYETFRFRIVGISPRRYADGEDALLMERRN